MRLRFGVLATVMLLAITACGSGGSSKGGGGGLGGTTTVPVAKAASCPDPKPVLTSPEIGVTDTTITITTLADVDNGFRPGLFKGSWDGVQAWAKYINDNGGLACRQVVVKAADSKLSGDEAKNQISTACTNSLALVGTTALFLSDVSGMNNCKDKAGAATGLPDLANIQTEAVQQCSPVSFAVDPNGSECPYSGTGPRTFHVENTSYDWYLSHLKELGADSLHGVFVIPKDTSSTILSTMPIYRVENQLGIKADKEIGMSGTAQQNDYTSVISAIKQSKATYVRNNLDSIGTVLMRKEAAAQGVDTVKVWDCSFQCYDERMTAEPSTEGQYVWLNILPLEDRGHNAEIDALLKYLPHPDGWAMQGWIAGEILARAISDAMKAHNNDPNAITRANVLAATKAMHDFDANGMTPKLDVGGKTHSGCLVGMQVKGGKFVRIDPLEPGTFDCDNNKLTTIRLDAKAEYHG